MVTLSHNIRLGVMQYISRTLAGGRSTSEALYLHTKVICGDTETAVVRICLLEKESQEETHGESFLSQ